MKTTVQNPDLARFVEAGTLYLGAPEAAELVRRHGVAACIEAIAANIRADFLRWPISTRPPAWPRIPTSA